MENMVSEMKNKVQGSDYSEGKVARSIESVTAKVPSDVYLWAAFTAMGVSFALHFTDMKKTSVFIGQWAPSILILGLYNKLVKVEKEVAPHQSR